ncbi:MAG: histidinol phosphatase [Allomuricauda sp.]|nr:MAG: histidinol phosphatase [Allomuricauda sp.]
MFDFFSRKIYLVDLLKGFVDIHNHILPGIDDGAKTIEQSLDLIKGFAEFGVKNFVCTPHIMHNYYENTPASIAASYDKLKLALAHENMEDTILDRAAEHMIDDNFEDLLARKDIMPLKKYHLLVEMSFLQAPINFDRAIQKITSAGYFPILAHPERYGFLRGNFRRYESLKRKNILFQVNLLSLAGYYGDDKKSMAYKLIEKDLVEFLASDVHNADQLNAIKETTIPKRYAKKLNPLVNKTIETFW